MKKNVLSIVKAILVVLALNVVGSFFYARLDLTEDARYTLSQAAKQSVDGFNKSIIVDVLLDGDLPAEFHRLKTETEQLLEEFASVNKNIKINFVDPLADAQQTETVFAQLQSIGLKPANVTIEENGKVSQEVIFPWAMVNYGQKTVKVPLLKNRLGASSEERINNSVQHLEYAFADAFTKLKITDKKSIAVIKGNGELEDIYLADYLTAIKEYYNIGAITLDSVARSPQKVLDQLKNYDLAIIAKPTQRFTDSEKYVLDQFVANGGKSIWLIDKVAMELDSLFNETGSNLAIKRDLNLDDLFFKYGVRINPVLVSDMYFTQIVLANGEGNDSQFNPVPWYFNPMVFSKNDHPINNNLEALRFQFTSTLDTLPNPYKKTVLYTSSPLSKTVGVPSQISFDIINKKPKKENFDNGNRPLAVLIEGKFSSAFKNRVKPLHLTGTTEENTDSNGMLIIADGDVIKNQVKNGQPLELGFDKWTSNFFGNKEFLINSINYLLDDSGLINIRNKHVGIPLLDPKKVEKEKTKWQLINIGLPVLLTFLSAFAFNYHRRKKYGE